MVKTFLLIN